MGTKFYKASNLIRSRGNSLSETSKIFFIFILFISGHFSSFSQTTPISLTQIALSSTDLIAHGRGAEYWNGVSWTNGSGGGVLVPTGNTKSSNAYYRFDWGIEIETSQGVYNWAKFDQQINSAIDNGQMFSFGLMPMCTACSNTGIGGLTYPLYLHTLMQAEAAGSQDWFYSAGNVWVPNWNSPNYLGRYQALLNAVAAHIASGSHNGKNYKDVIYYVDIRGYGDFGEWHTYPWYGTEPAGRKATSATLKALIDMNLAAFPNYPNVIMISAFNQGGASQIPTDVSYYALTKSNAWGPLGWRRDNWGDPNTDNILANNGGSYNPGSGSVAFAPLITSRYKTSPIVGEPNNATGSTGAPYADLSREINLYHATSFGDGNFPNAGDPTTQANIIACSKISGYRLIITGGNMTTTLTSGGGFSMSLNWQNIGVAPVYENWNVVYELRKSDGTVVWKGNSSFTPKLFIPQGSPTTVSDNFTLSAVAAGTYSMYVIVRDPLQYKAPLQLAITGRNADGSYLLRSNITIGTGPANQPPTAKAGGDQTIQLPVSSVSFTGTGSDPDGTISTYSWTKISGPASGSITTPAAAATTVTGLTQGVYQYVLTVTDNLGASAKDTVQVTVNAAAANLAPIAKAGTDQTITLPVSSVTIDGSASSDPDGSISTFLWTKISGPAQFTIGNNNTANTLVSNLTAGLYSFQLKVTDNGGATALDTVKVTVNPALVVNQPPVSNAGSDQIITLPTSSVTISGSASSDPDGTISTYLWTKISGPAQFTIGNSNTANTLVSNLTAGSYSFQLKVTDNGGATALDTVKVTVNPALVVNQPPASNAGSDQAITLPTSSVTINGSASSDPDGTISNYLWSKISGPAQFTIGNSGSASTLVSNLTAGLYSFQLKVTDNAGATALDTVNVTVNPALVVNQPPVSNAGSDQIITLPTNSVTINGSASSDPDGSISTYLWTKISGPAQLTIGNTGSASTLVSNLTAGLYLFQLKVTDNGGAIALDTVNVTVNPALVVNQPPVSNAGSDQIITLPTNSVTINGSASSDPDGSISTYLWTKISGPAQLTIGNTGSASTLVSNLTAGLYLFQLKVTDNGGAIALDTVKVNVNAAPANQLPVANAGADHTITLPTNIVNLDGSGSSDPDGTISAYAWSQLSGPGAATITSGTNAIAGISGLQQGIYVFVLKVTDNSGATNLDSTKVTVNQAPNMPPVANAGTSKSITLPVNSVSLDGSLSNDPDGSISIYNWTQISGPSGAVITGANASVATASSLVAGLYTFQLTITDNSGATANATVKITVVSNTIQPPIANAGADKTITLPTNSVVIDGSASSASSGNIVSYVWTENSGPSTIPLNNTVQNTLTNLQAGIYVFSLTVSDSSGATASDLVTITVKNATNNKPVANAGSNRNLTLSKKKSTLGGTGTTPLDSTASTTLDGTASYDPDGSIASYSWTQVSGPSSSTLSGSNTATVSVSGLIVGQYIYQLTVVDNSGDSSSAQVKVIVSPAANVVPVANAGPNQSITAPASTVILDGSASSDPDGSIAAYSWVTISGPGSITISNSNTATPSAQGLTTGVYIFELTVTDNSGATAKDQVTVIVNPKPILPNQLPVANAGTNQTISEPENSLSLNGSSSFDPDGTITDYSWTQVSGPSSSVISAGNTTAPTVSQLITGQYVYQLTVTDNNGATNTDQVTITVNPATAKINLSPVADAGNNDTLSLPTNTYTLDASRSTDPDGTIASYEWRQISGPGTANSSAMNNAQVTLSNLEQGEYQFEVTVTDNAGATSTATMRLTIEQGFSLATRISVFPNPTTNVINEKITSSIMGTVKINVYDMNGRLVLTAQEEKTSDVIYTKMNVTQLAPGMYTIQVNVANRKTIVSKFIKN